VNSLKVNLDFNSGIPIYIQIVDQVRALLLSGDLKPGDQLPTVRQLASELRVNFNTIARAYRLLDEARLISTQRGRGTYLLDADFADNPVDFKRDSIEVQVRTLIQSLVIQGYSVDEVRQTMEKLTKSNNQ
jgi:GntR family transcriptional regulator